MIELEQVLEVLVETLPTSEGISEMHEESPLLGAIPDLDSMAVVSIITSIEERFDVVLEDDELDADVFETVGTLRNLILSKVNN